MSISQSRNRFQFKIPHTFVILFSLIIIAAIATWIIPAGQYDRVEDPNTGKMTVVPSSFKYIKPSPVGFFDTFVAVQKGMVDAASIIFFIFIVYASIYIVLKTGALDNAIAYTIKRLEGKELLIIPISMYLFGLGGAIFGMSEETLAFIPIMVSLAIALGYDAIVGMSMVSLGVNTGFSAAFMNPFTIGVAQGIANLPLFSGMGFRIVNFIVFETLAVLWTMRYAAKIKKNPSASIVKDLDYSTFKIEGKELNTEFTGRQKIILIIVGLTMAVLIYGVLKLGWYIDELAGLFLIMGIACGFVGGFNSSKIAEYFVEGCKEVISGAFVVGLGRGILMVMNQGKITDTIVYALSQPLLLLPKWVAAEGMLLVQTLISFFIPSGSGMAAVTMPIMAPLADVLNITRQVAVLAFQYGDGFSNLLWPTTLIPVICGIAKVPIDRWWKYYTPFFFMLLIVQMIFIAVAVAINYGPF
ncbi:MAG: TIGR00366 family protein [Thermosediminibacteraceae bacterium]|nr:TIGR00366 family protein [Thermosediminibacteraceae bacterium]